LLIALGERVRILRGNADRIVLEDDGEESRWARDRLGPERLAAVAAWLTSFVLEVEGLGRVRCCHATPSGDEDILTPITPEAEAIDSFEGTLEEVVVGGHTHIQFERRIRGWRFVNVGSVGRPRELQPGRLLGAARAGRRARLDSIRRAGCKRGGAGVWPAPRQASG
jgi:predicted phosphodiesterase